jgi:uroporphyrin-3 C-methyltransferase
MIDKAASYEADKQPLDTTVDALDSLDTHSAAERKPAGGRFALFLAALSLLFTLIGIAAGYKLSLIHI